MNVKKYTITSIKIKETKTVDGEEVKYVYSKGQNAGKNFVRVSITTEETGDTIWSANQFPDSKATKLSVGEKVLMVLEERKGEGDNVWFDFKFPNKDELAAYALNQ